LRLFRVADRQLAPRPGPALPGSATGTDGNPLRALEPVDGRLGASNRIHAHRNGRMTG
jgi:hypothetical protein